LSASEFPFNKELERPCDRPVHVERVGRRGRNGTITRGATLSCVPGLYAGFVPTRQAFDPEKNRRQ